MSVPTLESLRAQGLDGHDPVRFHYLQTLAARLPGQPEDVRRVLAQRLQCAVTAYAERARPARVPPPAAAPLESPLAQLNRELQDRAQADADGVPVDSSASDLRSVREFGEVWSRISAERQVAQALDRGPENAGPLNPHKLMLRSLSLMRGLSPDYLRRFLAQMDALLWLEQAQARPQRAPLRPGRAGRAARG